MKILTICQYYYPEPFRITDICEELVKRGHEVTVVTGVPNYPMGQIYEGYRHGEKRDEVINGVKVHRCFTIGRRSGAVCRFLNYYSYVFSSSLYVRKLEADYDVVFVNQLSPVMMTQAGIKYKKKHDKKLVLYCLDLWPESLVFGGVRAGSLLYKLFHRVSLKIYQQADRILVTSRSFSGYFDKMFGITGTDYLPQYAESMFNLAECRKEPNETIDLMFAGNIGAAQSVETIIKAAALTKDIQNLRWHIVGDGSEIDNVKKLGQELTLNNVLFHGRKPLEEMPKYYAMADAMLVTMQADPVLSLTLPGKVQSYMAAGKPILGAIGTEAKSAIIDAGCGFCTDSGNAEGLARYAKCFCELTPQERALCGKNAEEYYKSNYSGERFISQLIQAISESVNNHHTAEPMQKCGVAADVRKQ